MKDEETLEEAAEKYINDDLDLYESLVDGHISYNIGINLLNKLFVEGAKWQQERMYSEEEVRDMLFEALNEKKEKCCVTNTTDSIVRKILKQFKKEII